jgi:hypothetical protein
MTYDRFEQLPVWREAIEIGRLSLLLTENPGFKGQADQPLLAQKNRGDHADFDLCDPHASTRTPKAPYARASAASTALTDSPAKMRWH